MSLSRICVFLTALVFCLPALAQEHNTPTFHHLTIGEGLSGNHVSAILQDRKGFIWIASTALQRYDGNQLITIAQFDRLPGSIYYNDIALHEDRQGRIWMGTPEDIRYFDPLTARVKDVPLEAGLRATGNINCHTIVQDSQGTVWATTRNGLVQLDEAKQVFRKPSGIPDSVRSRMNSAIAEDGAGRLWISGQYGLYILGKDRKTIFGYANNPAGISALNIRASARKIFKDRENRMWIATRGENDLCAWQPASNRLRTYRFPMQGNNGSDQVYDITADQHGNIWVAMEHEGLYRHSNASDSFSLHIPGNREDALGLHFNYETNCLLSDRDGHMWVGTDLGVNITSLHNQSFTRLDHRTRFPGTAQRLPQAEVTGVFSTANGDVYIGYWGAGIARLDPRLHLRAYYPRLPDERAQAWSFAEQHSGHVLIGQENGYISRYDPQKNSFSHHHPPAFEDEAVLAMLPETDTSVWAGLYNNGLVNWNPENDQVHTFPQLFRFIRNSTSIMGIVPQGDSVLWLAASNGGLLRFRKSNGEVDRQIIFRCGEEPVNNITSLLRYNDSTLLAGTSRGLYFYNLLQNTWQAQLINESPFDDWILSMHPAGGQDVWITTPYGFYRLSGAKRRLIAFIQNDDIIDNHRRVRRNIATMPDGWMLVGASDHVTAFSIDRLQPKPPPPNVTITDFKVLEQSIIVDSVVDTGQPLILSHEQNFISIAFKSLQYHDIKTRYYYRLVGVDADWLPTEDLQMARYTNLPPGEYTFRVKSMNMAGVFSRHTTTLHIHIRPSFWQTWWFKALCILAVLALVYGYFRFRVYLVKKEEKGRAAIREELAQLEMKALRAQMNPHFIFNSLNSIQTFMMKNETEQALSYLSRFARLIRNVLDNSQLNNISITRETGMLENYMELEKLRLADQFDYRIIIDPALDSDFVEIPAMVIQPFIENAIWHGLLHKTGRGLLTIEFIRKENRIHCIVEDNGIGRTAATALKMQSHPSHVSRGLQITKDRLQLYNSRFNMDASFDIEDLYDEAGQARGTRVNLWFPLEED